MPASVKHVYFIFAVLFTCLIDLKAQTVPYLERKVTIRTTQPISEIFKNISNQTGVLFSYSSSFDDKRKVNLNVQNKPLRLLMNELLKSSNCTYKVKDKYIIIKCDGKPADPPSVITGYIYSGTDSTGIPQASIYVKQTKHSTLSNDYGFFSLTCSNKLSDLLISFAKEDFQDTSIVVYNQGKKEVLVYLFPKETKNNVIEPLSAITLPVNNDSLKPLKSDSTLSDENYVNLFLQRSEKLKFNLKNITDTLFSTVSVSFTPYVSTNHLLSVNTVNKYAFNILGGYSLGTRVLEIGGLFNIDEGNVSGAQIGGLFNLVGDTVKGAEIGGLFNVTGKQMKGFQAAGLFNLNMENTKGVQVAGLLNINGKKMNGVSIAGLGSVSDTLQGVTLGGLFNATTYSSGAVEIAGICNEAGVGKSNNQLSAIYNKTPKGTTANQLSVFYNKAHLLKGVQIGLINYCDSASGIPIGFLSIVKKGYHKLEIASDELMFASLAFHTGVPRLYGIFMAGVNYNRTNLWTFGYGLGSDLVLKNKWGLTFNLTTQHIQSGNKETEWNLLNKAVAGVSYQLFSKIRMELGPTFNLLLFDTTIHKSSPSFGELSSWNMYQPNDEYPFMRMFVGAKLGIKFF